MIERLCLCDLDILSVAITVEALGVPTDVEVSPGPAMLVEFDFSRAAHVHEVCALVRGQNCLQRLPVRLPNVDRELIAGGHDAAPAAGGTPRCVCLQPMQHTAAVIFLIASWNFSGASIGSPLRL